MYMKYCMKYCIQTMLVMHYPWTKPGCGGWTTPGDTWSSWSTATMRLSRIWLTAAASRGSRDTISARSGKRGSETESLSTFCGGEASPISTSSHGASPSINTILYSCCSQTEVLAINRTMRFILNGVGTNFGVEGGKRGEARRAESEGWGSWGGDNQPLPTN